MERSLFSVMSECALCLVVGKIVFHIPRIVLQKFLVSTVIHENIPVRSQLLNDLSFSKTSCKGLK